MPQASPMGWMMISISPFIMMMILLNKNILTEMNKKTTIHNNSMKWKW